MCLNSSAFITIPHPGPGASSCCWSGLAFDEAGLDRQLGGAEVERLARGHLVDAIELEHDAARLDPGHPQLRRALARAHAHLGWLFGHRHIREDADPHPPGALHGAGNGAPRRLDLARRQPLRLDRLEAVGAEIERGSALGVAVNAALVRLAELGTGRLQHNRCSLWARLFGLPFGPAGSIATTPAPAAAARLLRLDGALLGRHRIVIHDLALEDPHLDANDAVGGLRHAIAEVDVGAQRVQGHAALAIPFDAGDFGAAEPAGAVDADPERTQAQRRLHGALHGPAEGNAALQLLGNGLGHQGGVDLRLSDFDDIEVHFRRRQFCQLAAQLLDVGTLLADQDAGAGGVDGEAAFLVRALDHSPRDAGLAPLLEDVIANVHVLVQQLAVLAATGEPAAVPGAVDADPQSDRIDLVTHYSVSFAAASSARSFTITVSWEKGFWIALMRPRPRA